MSENQPKAKDSDAVHPKDPPCAKDIMTRNLHTVGAEMDLHEVASFLVKHEISNAPVVRRENNQLILLGFISEEDCLEYLASGVFYGNPTPPQTAETIMKKHPICVDPDQDIFTLTSIFTSHHYRHMPVVEEGHLVGIVSRRDIIRALESYFQEWSNLRDSNRFRVDLRQLMNLRFLAGR